MKEKYNNKTMAINHLMKKIKVMNSDLIDSFAFLFDTLNDNCVIHYLSFIIYLTQLAEMKPENGKKRVIVIGGGLSGLSAANQLLKACPNLEVTVL